MTCSVLVFAKAPEPGAVKTRLIPALGSGGAAVLAARMIRRTLSTVKIADVGPIELWCTPDASHPLFALCQRDFGASVHIQSGDDLGGRMANAVADALSRADQTILIGTDIPTLEVQDLEHAKQVLIAGEDAVIGPTADGGYYLIGLRTPACELFEDMRWSTDAVFRETLRRVQALNWSMTTIAERWDVDVPQDLERLAGESSCASLLSQLSWSHTVDFSRTSNDTRAS